MGGPEIPRGKIFDDVAGVGHVEWGWFARGGTQMNPFLLCLAMCEYSHATRAPLYPIVCGLR